MNFLKLEIPDCDGEFAHHFPTVLMLSHLCVCVTPSDETNLKYLSYTQISLCLVGVVVLLLCLVVTSTMITRSSVAVLVSILLLYMILRLAAVGLVAGFTLVNRRLLVHRVASAAWLLGTWGVHFTLMDLAFEQVVAIFLPMAAQVYANPLRSLKRTSVVLIVGLVACSVAIVEAVTKTRRINIQESVQACSNDMFYFAYWRWYQAFLVGTIFAMPMVLLTMTFLVLVGLLIQKKLCSNRSPKYYPRNYVNRDVLEQQVCVLCVLGWNLALNLPLTFYLVLMQSITKYVQYANLMELCALLSTVTTPIPLLLWQRFRTECCKAHVCSSRHTQPTNLSVSRSVSTLGPW